MRAPVDVAASAHTAKDKGPGVTGIMEQVEHSVVPEFSPDQLPFALAMA